MCRPHASELHILGCHPATSYSRQGYNTSFERENSGLSYDPNSLNIFGEIRLFYPDYTFQCPAPRTKTQLLFWCRHEVWINTMCHPIHPSTMCDFKSIPSVITVVDICVIESAPSFMNRHTEKGHLSVRFPGNQIGNQSTYVTPLTLRSGMGKIVVFKKYQVSHFRVFWLKILSGIAGISRGKSGGHRAPA